MDHNLLKERYSDSQNFDPEGFFFITYRSNTIGNCLVWPGSYDLYWIEFLCADQSYREKRLEETLAGLAIEYMNKHKPEIKTLYIRPFDDFQKQILEEMGFEEE